MTLTSGGNLGLGVTPSAWASGFTAMQVRNASFWSTGNDASITANAYYDGSNYRFIGNAGASRVYHNTDGSIGWSQVASGTAGNAISFSQAMTLTSGGNLLVGTTTDAGFKLDVNGTGRFSSSLGIGGATSTNGFLEVFKSGGSIAQFSIGQNSTYHTDFFVDASGNFYVQPQGNTALTITSGGNVGIGTASPNVNGLSTALTINGSSTSGLEINANSVNQGYLIASTSAMVLNARTNIPLLFYTNDTERLRITSGGNVGIGTGSPSDFAALTLVKNGASNYSAVACGNSNSTATLFVGVGGSSVANTALRNNAYLLNASNSDLIFGTNDTEQMRITSGGNVLIGTSTNGASKLRISGLPTSSSGLSSGDIWNDLGTLKIA